MKKTFIIVTIIAALIIPAVLSSGGIGIKGASLFMPDGSYFISGPQPISGFYVYYVPNTPTGYWYVKIMNGNLIHFPYTPDPPPNPLKSNEMKLLKWIVLKMCDIYGYKRPW